jgi:hypothetical protein
MSKWFRSLTIVAFVGGCAIHPLPENVTGVKTYDIVKSIRCEARDALRKKIIAFLAGVGGDPAATKYAVLLQEDVALWAKFNDRWFSPPVTAVLRYFEGSAIAYNFNLDMTEVNNFDPTIDLSAPVPFGTFTTALTGGVDRSRENTRQFTITDTFLTLVQKLDEVYCAPYVHVENYMYPITGKIGVDEMVDTFVELALFANLSASAGGGGTGAGSGGAAAGAGGLGASGGGGTGHGGAAGEGGGPGAGAGAARAGAGHGGGGAAGAGPATSGKPPTMADDLVFITKLSFGATPKVVFTPFKSGLSDADASVATTFSRQDKHEVTVGMSLPTPPAGSHPTQLLITAQGGVAQQAAAQAVEQSILRNQLNRRSSLIVLP